MPRNPSQSSLIGQTIGDRLEIVRMLGSGGMGEVYVARHIELDVNRAVKVMRADLVSSSQAEARFKREAMALSRLLSSRRLSCLSLSCI